MRPVNPPRLPVRDNRGMTSIEYAIIVVAFFLILFTVVQAAFFYRARGDARSAAAACAEAARGDRAGSGQGRTSGESVVRQGGNMRSYAVSVSSCRNPGAVHRQRQGARHHRPGSVRHPRDCRHAEGPGHPMRRRAQVQDSRRRPDERGMASMEAAIVLTAFMVSHLDRDRRWSSLRRSHRCADRRRGWRSSGKPGTLRRGSTLRRLEGGGSVPEQ